MSDTEAEDAGRTEPAAGRGEIWIEKYRPETLDGVVGHEDVTERLKRYVEQDDLPHLLFAGPAGTGKCVTGETPVLTNRGVERIGAVVGDRDGFDEPDDGLEVLTFDRDGTFRFVKPTRTFSKRADGVVAVETRDGGELTTTPEHPLLVLGDDGLEWTQAGDLDSGDRIARPLRVPLPEVDSRLDWVAEMDGERTLVHVTEEFAREHDIPVEEDYVGEKKRVIGRLRRGDDVETISDAVDVTRKTARKYRREVESTNLDANTTTCSLTFLRELDPTTEELREHVTAIQHTTRYNNRSRPIAPPHEVTPDMAAFVGLAVSEARIDGGRIQFYNTDESLLDRFERFSESVFDVSPTRGENKSVPYVEICNRTLTHFLESCFGVFDGATGGDGIGSRLVTSDAESRSAFLRAVFDAEAYVGENGTIELTQKNERLITLLSYLLAGFGIPSRRRRERKSATNGSGIEREYHVLYVSGARPLARFQQRVGFTIASKAERLAKHAALEPNPNQDTVPVQRAVDELCTSLYLRKGELLTDSLDPENPGRESYLEDVERVLDAAVAKVETAQEVLEGLDRLSGSVEGVTAVPATWIHERPELVPLETRTSVSEATGIRKDRLLEYADGRRTPGSHRVSDLLVVTEALDEQPAIAEIQSELAGAIERLGVPYAHVAAETDLLGTEVINLLKNEAHDLASLTRFDAVAERVRDVAAGMLSTEVLEALRTLDVLASGELYFDEVVRTEREVSGAQVYDLTVPDTHNYVAGNVPTVMHNTASAVAIARELYGEEWTEHFLELNASDQRGIDVVRNRIKDFARSAFGGVAYRIIFLDEADALTSDAQSALRRTMEQFSSNTRFILSCNYSSRIIDPIQSRCAVFRFSPLSDEAVERRVREIADAEDVAVTDDGVAAIVYAADGDMRRAINALQAAAVTGETVDEDAVYTITATARPEEVHEMVQRALDGDFTAARARLDDLLTEKGIAGGDVVDQLHRAVWEFEIDDEQAVRLLDRVGEADYRITEGANERIQLEALLASLALDHGSR